MAKPGHVMPFNDMTGQRCGRLVVLRRAKNAPNGSAAWVCRCDCGNERVVKGTTLREAVKKNQPLGCRICSVRGGHPGARPEVVVGARCGRCSEPTVPEDFVEVKASPLARARGCMTRKICKGCFPTYDPERVICAKCGSMPHRVVGSSCSVCHLAAGQDEPVVLPTTGMGRWDHVKSGRGTAPVPKRQARAIIAG